LLVFGSDSCLKCLFDVCGCMEKKTCGLSWDSGCASVSK